MDGFRRGLEQQGPIVSNMLDGDSETESINQPRSALAYAAIREAILTSRLAPGLPITESYLARELKMSKTPIREALQRLASEDLVVLDPFRGASVRPVSPQLVTDLYEIRELLEPLAVRQAAPHLSEDAFSRLRAAVAEGTRALAQFDVPEMGRTNWVFHAVLIEHASNPQLKRILQAIEDQFRSFTTVIWLGPDVRAREHQDHAAMLAALDSGQDPSAVGDLMADHLSTIKKAVVDAVAASGSEDITPFGAPLPRGARGR